MNTRGKDEEVQETEVSERVVVGKRRFGEEDTGMITKTMIVRSTQVTGRDVLHLRNILHLKNALLVRRTPLFRCTFKKSEIHFLILYTFGT